MNTHTLGRLARFAASLFCLAASQDPAFALTTVTIDLVGGTEYAGDPVVNPPGGMLSHYEELGGGLFGTVEASALASVSGWSTHFATFAQSDNNINATAQASLSIESTDSVAITGGSPPGLIYRYVLSGFVQIAPFESRAAHIGTLIVNGYDIDLSVPGPILYANQLERAVFDVPVALSPVVTPVSTQVVSECTTLSQDGLCLASFSSTLTLSAVFLPDGSTPESQGMTLSFDSGLTSPNLDGIVESTFDADNQGWTVGDLFLRPGVSTAIWQDAGGNPGGFLRTTDLFSWNAYLAPAEFLGDQSAAYGGVLHLEQKLVTSDGGEYPMVLLSDGVLVLQFWTAPPGTEWTPYDIPLVASAGWQIATPPSGNPGPPATEEQLQQVLANLTSMTIEADWQTGDDQIDLDNVRLLPEPNMSVLLVSGVSVLFTLFQSGRRRAGRAHRYVRPDSAIPVWSLVWGRERSI